MIGNDTLKNITVRTHATMSVGSFVSVKLLAALFCLELQIWFQLER